MKIRMSGVLLACLAASTVGAQDYRLDKLRDIFNADVRVLSMGDSFSMNNGRNIVPKIVSVWPVTLTAIESGAAWTPMINVQSHVPIEYLSATSGYDIRRSTPGDEFFTLPIQGLREVYGPVTGPQHTYTTAALAPPLRWWPLGWDDTVTQGIPVDAASLVLGENVPPNTYSHSAGCVVSEVSETGVRIPGLYFSTLADSSWSWGGLGSEQLPQHNLHKVYPKSQFEDWLDATTLDVEQPLYVFYNLDTENITEAAARLNYARAIDKTQCAAESVGLSDVWHCIIVPHMHNVLNLNDEQATHVIFQRNEELAIEVAAARPNVSVMSLYSATGRICFDGRTEAVRWLKDTGWEEIVLPDGSVVNLVEGYGGDLLDEFDVHTRNSDAGVFFCMVMLDRVINSQRGDVTNDCTVNLDDLLLVIAQWASPYDLDDLLDVIGNWGSSCEVSRRTR